MSLLTAISTVMILSPVGNAVTQNSFPVKDELGCKMVAQEMIHFDVEMENGKYSKTEKVTQTVVGRGDSYVTTIIRTIECVMRPEGVI